MKKLLGGVALLWLACGIAWAQSPVAVYDVGVEPDSQNKKVTVTYRMAETNIGVANVAVDISSDAGETWTVPAKTFYPGSDVGPGIPADGSLRQLVWDARADWNQQYSTQMVVRLNATAAETQNGLFFSAADKVYRMNLDGGACTVIASGLAKPEQLLVDYANQKLWISLWYSGSPILGYNLLQGGGAPVLYNGPGYTGAQGLAYDPAAGLAFMGLYYNGVYRMDLQAGTGWQRIVSTASLSPMIGQRGQMVLDPARQHIYFRSAYNGDCDECRWIWRANYDGTGLIQITRANGGDALAIDPAAGHLYFSDDPSNGTIYRANLDGSGLQTLATLPTAHGFCSKIVLDVPGGKMYMNLSSEESNWRDRSIASMNLDGSGFEVLKELSNCTDGWGIALYLP